MTRSAPWSRWVLWGVMLSLSHASKLNVPRVLLPFSEEDTQFVLYADESDKAGCFKWKSSRPELVSITPINEDPNQACSSSAVVASVSKSRSSKVQSVITAEDVRSPGHLLRCDVIVDNIFSLQIVTKTHELYLEEAPEEFQVRAYDDQGNEFSTLKRMIFKWTIDNNVKKPGTLGDNIRFINFRDSTYAFEDTLMAIEAQNKQGHKVLLEGIKTGSSKVSVKVVSALYSKVPPATVNVMCVANLFLMPSNAYVMMGGYVDYHAEQIKSNKVHLISLPTQQYFLAVANSEIVKLESESSSEVVGHSLGSTEVYLKDHNVHPDDYVRPPTAEIHVVTPAYITLSIHPYNNWNVLLHNHYEISVEIFDSNNNRIYPSDNIEMKVDIPQDYFKTEERSRNGTWHSGSPIQVGIADVSATLYGVKDRHGHLIELKSPLSASAQLEIFDGILLDPALAIFPWDPVSRPSFQIQYVVQGAGAPFLWSSSNQTVATVTQNGVALTNPDNVGGTEIKAAMNRASHNYGRARVLVLPSGGLAILNHVIEREIGTSLDVPLQFFANHESKKHVFTQCHKLLPTLTLSDGKIFDKNPYSHGSAVPHLDLTWDVGQQDSASLVSVFHRNHLELGRDNNGVMRLIAKKPGRVTIKLRAKISKSIPGAGQCQFESDRPLADDLEIQVIEDLDLKAPWLEENTLLMGTNSQFQLRTNRDSQGEIRYTVLSKPSNMGDSVTVTDGGLVKASRTSGTSIVLVEDFEDYGLVERMSIVVDVKPISYMMLNVAEAFQPVEGSLLNRVPKGITLPMSVSYHDNTGLRFDATHAETAYRPNRFDTLAIKEDWNNSLTAEAIKEEYTVFRTYAGIKSRPDLQDFVIFNVARGIFPDMGQQSVMIGDVVDLDNLITSGEAEDEAGSWTADPSGRIVIDPVSGMATCIRSGAVKVSYTFQGEQRISVDFHIRSASKLLLDRSSLVIRAQRPQYVPFHVQSEFGNETTNFYGAQRPAGDDYQVEESPIFSCTAKFLSHDHKLGEFYHVRAVFHHGLRTHACELAPKSPLLQSKSVLIASDIEVRVAPEYSSNVQMRADAAAIPFHGGFFLVQEDLQLSNAEPTGVIAVQGLASVLGALKVEASNDQWISVGREYYEGPSLKMIPIYLRTAFWHEAQPGDQLSVSLVTVQQEQVVPLKVIYAGSTCTNTELNWSSLFYFILSHYQSLLFITFSCLICVLLTKILLKNASSATSSTGLQAPKSATQTSTSLKSPLLGSASPQSPMNLSNADNRPYLWTVDNSPIYGSPSFSRRSPRSLTQYSYTDQ
eukprot:maker-scaffold60_size442463-snap-gene-0.28 protein:Tk12070 transcript:maker-scaffold60_size442463-snap-gene-0.28-mRNA-1 annotation:"nuclear pore membrane glycoprotein 210"